MNGHAYVPRKAQGLNLLWNPLRTTTLFCEEPKAMLCLCICTDSYQPFFANSVIRTKIMCVRILNVTGDNVTG